MRYRRKSSRNPIRLSTGEKVYTKKEVDRLIAKLRKNLGPDEVAEIVVEDEGGDYSRTQEKPAQRESGRYGKYASSGSQSRKPKGKGKKGKEGKKTEIKDPHADVTYMQGKEIGAALGRLVDYCPKALRPTKEGTRFSNGQALTEMGLNKGTASRIITKLRTTKDPVKKYKIVIAAFKKLNISCPIDD